MFSPMNSRTMSSCSPWQELREPVVPVIPKASKLDLADFHVVAVVVEVDIVVESAEVDVVVESAEVVVVVEFVEVVVVESVEVDVVAVAHVEAVVD